jgi:hypothetical protein
MSKRRFIIPDEVKEEQRTESERNFWAKLNKFWDQADKDPSILRNLTTVNLEDYKV